MLSIIFTGYDYLFLVFSLRSPISCIPIGSLSNTVMHSLLFIANLAKSALLLHMHWFQFLQMLLQYGNQQSSCKIQSHNCEYVGLFFWNWCVAGVCVVYGGVCVHVWCGCVSTRTLLPATLVLQHHKQDRPGLREGLFWI